MRMTAPDGSPYEADVLEVYSGILAEIRSFAPRPEEVTKGIMDRWETMRRNLSEAIVDFKKDCEMHPYTKEGHLAKLQLDDLEAQMRQLLEELAEKAGIR
ncbi:unnamed protein product [Symbiodinium natans]|uniref:Uncharacterized protein n=1 Tax=Symbiodinium natans TaxID=878477 RepID=A0A812M8X7_9DINO|nr:unnamed protein product [Symbiodinium natans]